MRIVTVGAIVFGRRVLRTFLRQVFLLLGVAGEAEIVPGDRRIYLGLVAHFFVFVACVAAFRGRVHHCMLD